MATYVNDLRLKEITTGDESGTWGTSTNTNLELIANAMGLGAEAIPNASTHTITMADGAADEFRSTFLRLTGGGQACTVTLGPSTLSHTWIMRNETAAALTLTQGSGANVVIAAGQTKIVSTDGGGAGAIVYEMDDLELAGNLIASAATITTLASSAATLTGGTVNGMVVGGSTPAAGTFTTLTANTSATVSGDLTVDTSTLKVDSTNNRVGILNASPDVVLDIGSSTDAVHMPVGTTGQRPTGAAGYFRYNSTLSQFEGYTDGWGAIGGGGGSNLVSNTMTGDGSTTTISLTNNPQNENNTQVYIDGVYQNKDTYSVSGTTLTFSTAPPLGTAVEVMTIEPTAINIPADGSVTSAKLSGALTTPSNLTIGGTLSLPNANATNEISFTGTEFTNVLSATTSGFQLGTTGAGYLQFLTGNTARMTIDGSSGSVGIGGSTITDSNLLNIQGSSASVNVGVVFNDTNTSKIFGIQNGGSALKFFDYTASTERMRIDSSGNVGIGNSIPSSFNGGANNLVVGSGSGAEGITIFGGAESNIFFADGTAGTAAYIGRIEYSHSSDLMRFYVNNLNAMTIDSSGNVGIGVTPPAWGSAYANVNVGSAASFWGTKTGASLAVMSDNSYFNGSAYLARNTGAGSKYYQNAGGHYWDNAASVSAGAAQTNVERMRLDASGNLLVGKTVTSVSTVGVLIQPSGNIVASPSTVDTYGLYASGNYKFYVGVNGTVYAVSTSISGISDVRYKENIRDLDDGLSKVMQLQPRKFDWKEGKGKDIANDRGFIAQEFEEVFPDLVSEWKDPAPEGEEPYKAVSQDLIPTLVKAIQEQQATIEALTQRIETLEQN